MSATSPTKSFKENIQGLYKLAQTSDQKDALLDAIERRLEAFPDYVNAVWNYEHQTQLAYIRYAGDTEMIQDKVTSIDRARRDKHNVMVGACNTLNRICDRLNTPRFCPDLETDAYGDEIVHRNLCADFCGDVVLETYENRNGDTLARSRFAKIAEHKDIMSTPHFDEATKLAKEHNSYDTSEMHRLTVNVPDELANTDNYDLELL